MIKIIDGKPTIEEIKDFKRKNSRSLFFDIDAYKKTKPLWFNWEELCKFDIKLFDIIEKYCAFRIINTEKGTGKTTWFINRIKKHIENFVKQHEEGLDIQDMFCLMFKNETVMKDRTSLFANNPQWPIKVKGNQILIKESDDVPASYWNRLIGYSFGISTFGNISGDDFSGIYNVYWDEYISKNGYTIPEIKNTPKHFLTITHSIKRNKEKMVKYWLFGNNEPGPSPIVEFKQVDKNVDYHIEPENMWCYFNLKAVYEGVSLYDNEAFWFSFGTEMNDFLVQNTTTDFQKGIVSGEEFEHMRNSKIHRKAQILCLNDVYLNVYWDYEKEAYYVESFMEYEEWDKTAIMFQKPTYGLIVADLAKRRGMKLLPESVARKLFSYYQADRLHFWKIGDRDVFEKIINSVISIEKD